MFHLLRQSHQDLQLERIHLRTQLALSRVPHTICLTCARTKKYTEMCGKQVRGTAEDDQGKRDVYVSEWASKIDQVGSVKDTTQK